MTRLYLIRHAKPAVAWGGEDEDPGLDSIGWDQARAVAEELMALPVAHRPKRVVSSPLRRCRETAQPFAAALGVTVEIVPEVGEIPTPADLDLAARPEWLRAAFSGRWADIRGDLDYDAWRQAVAAAVGALPATAVFSHFVAINAVLSLIEGCDEVIGFRPDHTSITTLDLQGRTLALVSRGREAATRVL